MYSDIKPNNSITTVILLDDHVFNRDVLARLLDTQEHLVVVGQADFSKEAMVMVMTLNPDVILAAPCLNPEVNLYFVEQLLMQKKDARVILIASSCSTEDLVKFICAGVSGVFLKSRKFDKFLEAINRVVVGELWFERTLLNSIVQETRAITIVQSVVDKRLDCLSKREMEVVELVVKGQNTNSIASSLGISEKTVRNHIYSIYGKLDVSDRLELARFASENGI